MVILGIDPGTATIGYGLIEVDLHQPAVALAYGIIQTDKRAAMPERLNVIFADIQELLSEYRPDVMVVEELFFLKNISTAIPVAQARGVLLLAAGQAGVPVVGYSPARIKQTIAGHGRADKRDMQEAIRDLLDLESVPRPDDAADALSVAMTHWQILEGTGETATPFVPGGRA